MSYTKSEQKANFPNENELRNLSADFTVLYDKVLDKPEVLADVVARSIRIWSATENVLRIEKLSAAPTPDSCLAYAEWLQNKADALEKQSAERDFLLNIDILSWWENASPIISQIADVMGVIAGTSTFIMWMRSLIRSRSKKGKEYAWIQDILCKDSWNVSDLSICMGINEDEAKKLLRGFGFSWDSHRMLYVETSETQTLRLIKIGNAKLY